jgi:tetratricopeptide (TPR) repeat protein
MGPRMFGRFFRARRLDHPSKPADADGSLHEMNLLTMDGRIALSSGDGKTALEKFKRLHVLIEHRFSSNSVFFATSFVDLAEAYALVRQKTEARLSLDQALSLYARIGVDDQRLDRLETSLLRVCERQGHFPAAEQVARNRIKRLAAVGTARDLDRASLQDSLDRILANQQRFAEALELLLDSRKIFEGCADTDPADYAVCLAELGHVYLLSQDFRCSEESCRKALAIFTERNGATSIEAAKALDDLAVTLAFRARESDDRQFAAESIDWATRAHHIFITSLETNHLAVRGKI